MYRFSSSGVDENQLPGVQTLPFKAFLGRRRAIEPVAQQGVADALHMYADLVCAAGFQYTADMRIALIGVYKLPVGDGGFGVFLRHSHALAVNRMPADWFVNGTGAFLEITSGDGLIYPVQTMVRQLGREGGVSKIVFGHNEKPGGVLIYSVYYTRSALAADT